MLNKIDNNRNNIQFGALKINKPLKEWNTDVLNAALNSRVIRNIIAKDAKDGKDTFLTLQSVNAGINKGTQMNMMSLNVKGAGKDLSFNAKTIIQYVKSGLFGKPEQQISGSKNLGQDIAKQIKSLDEETFSTSKAIEEIENIAGKIEVTQKEAGMDIEA